MLLAICSLLAMLLHMWLIVENRTFLFSFVIRKFNVCVLLQKPKSVKSGALTMVEEDPLILDHCLMARHVATIDLTMSVFRYVTFFE